MTADIKGQVELHKLIYTANWEDPRADFDALKIRPGETVLTITSGGCNTLAFLAADPAVIQTVDINPTQAFQLELKIEAMKRLGREEFIRFAGLLPARDRLRTYDGIRGRLRPEAAVFWDAHRDVIRKGLLLRGGYDRFVKLVGRVIRLTHGRKRLRGLLGAVTMDEQREWYDRYWDGPRTAFIFYAFYNKRVLARLGLDADYFHFDDGSHSFSESFRRKFRRLLHEVPVRGNYFLHVYLMGRYRDPQEVPDYLRSDLYGPIRERLDRIRIGTADAKRFLAAQPPNSIDCFALSNICELMSHEDTRTTFEEVLRTARPGARICFRNLILPREVPEDLRDSIRKDEPLSREIQAAERSFVYSKVAAYRVFK